MSAHPTALIFSKVVLMLVMEIVLVCTNVTMPQQRAQILVLVFKIVLLAVALVIRPSAIARTISQTMTTRLVRQKSIGSTHYVSWIVILVTLSVFLHVHGKKMKIWKSVHVVRDAPMDVLVMIMTAIIHRLRHPRTEISN